MSASLLQQHCYTILDFFYLRHLSFFFFFFFNDTATTEIYTLSLHDALPICPRMGAPRAGRARASARSIRAEQRQRDRRRSPRSEEHTSELQSPCNLVCRLLLEKKKKKKIKFRH